MPGLDEKQAVADRVFLTKVCDLEGRLDPKFNLARIRNKIESAFPISHLGKLCRSMTGGTPSTTNPEYWDGDIPWVSPKDFTTFYIGDSEDHITQLAVDESSTNIAPKGAMLIVFRSGVLLHSIPVGVTTRPVTLNQDVKALVFDDDILPAFVAYFFEVFQKQLLPLITKHGATVQSINTEQFNKLDLPVPPLPVQHEIIQVMDKAHYEVKRKKTDAQTLQDSADDYLTKALGVKMVSSKADAVRERLFIRPSSLLTGERWDAFYFQDKFVKFEESVRNAKFPAVNLGAELLQIFNGFDDRDSYEKGTPYLKVANIRPYEIGTTEGQNTQSDIPPRIKLQRNDILLTRKGSFGIAARVSEKSEGYAICSEIFKLRFSQRVDSLYVEAILNSTICQIQFDQLKIGAIMGSLTQDAVSKVLIPLPPIDAQRKIAQHISGIRAEARLLRSEAAEYLGSVKADVEKMILGEA